MNITLFLSHLRYVTYSLHMFRVFSTLLKFKYIVVA